MIKPHLKLRFEIGAGVHNYEINDHSKKSLWLLEQAIKQLEALKKEFSST